MKCPICNRDRNDPKAYKKSMLIIKANTLLSNTMNPGGRTLVFSVGEIHLQEQCNWCDYRFLKSRMKELKKCL